MMDKESRGVRGRGGEGETDRGVTGNKEEKVDRVHQGREVPRGPPDPLERGGIPAKEDDEGSVFVSLKDESPGSRATDGLLGWDRWDFVRKSWGNRDGVSRTL